MLPERVARVSRQGKNVTFILMALYNTIMKQIEYTTDGSEIGISIKNPAEIPRKWSECHTNIECECCGSKNISSDKSVDLLTIVCHDCKNFWYGSVDKVLTWHNTEEALVSLWQIPFAGDSDF